MPSLSIAVGRKKKTTHAFRMLTRQTKDKDKQIPQVQKSPQCHLSSSRALSQVDS